MGVNIEDCSKGDLVVMWCFGWRAWDNEVLKVVDNSGLLIELESKGGNTRTFCRGAQCKVVSF